MKRILWICGRLPSPLFTGDALYSTGLLKALALTNEAAITLIGTRRADEPIGDHLLGLPNTTCIALPAALSPGIKSLLSTLPRDVLNLSTPELRETLDKLLDQNWDWIVIDHAYSSGMLQSVEQKRKHASICYVAHNAEGHIRPQIAAGVSNPLRQIPMRLDAEKYRKQENRILQVANAVVCISKEDAAYFTGFSKNVQVIPPAYLGPIAAPRQIQSACPRALLLVGTFEWVAKQRNFELVVESLLPTLQRADISLNVVGAVSQSFRERFDRFSSHLSFHGRVDDISPYVASSRGGLVPDTLGGGFKLKVLDYAFARLPIFGLRNALAGTTAEEQSEMFLANGLADLADLVARNIDDLAILNQRQARLFDLFSARFGLEAATQRARDVFLKSA